ncbi:MAG: DEAD/DEAH box helicase [Halanaerobiales bacterium]|nr:DEAD/DEAH box helicase [Halanaerobiales bacterium]
MILKTKLYDHQIKAVEKIKKIKVGALYMEMGTGKTRTALELIKKRYNKNKIDHILWLCPCSVKETLKRELIKHVAGELSMFTICGIETLSSSIKTNFKLLNLVEKKKVHIIVDESNLVKNHRAKRTINIERLAGKCTYKLILNGTPISKCEKDLFSQWYILDWRILGYQSFWSFAANHLEYDERIRGKIRRCLNTDYLVRKIAPYTYQIKKEECLELPPKTYSTEYYGLSNEQQKHYKYVADKLLFELDELQPETIYRLFSGLQNVISGFRVTVGKHLKKTAFFDTPLKNPRIQLLLDLIKKTDHKMIIFCKFTQEIKDIIKVLNYKYGEKSAMPFYGEINLKQRQENIDAFYKKTKTRFLVANKTCAGYGLNLQFCNYIIYYSNDWNYATRSQSEDRVHRIGQKNNVHIIDICADNSLDERILSCLWKKENLVDSFKRQLENQKDKKEFLSNYFRCKGVLDNA